MQRTALASALALLSLAASAHAAPLAPASQSAVDSTDIGPLLSAAQQARWERLSSDAARAAFADEFWSRLDPTPGTPDNELRAIWNRRAVRADTHYGSGERPGQASDRGRVLLVLGLPDEIEARAPTGGTAPVELWRYDSGPYTGELRFVARQGEYELETEVPLSESAFIASAEEELRLLLAATFGTDEKYVPPKPAATTAPAAPAGGTTTGGLPTAATGATTGDATTTGAAGDAASADDAPSPADAIAPEVKIWMELVLGGSGRADLDLISNLNAFPAGEGTYTTLAFELEAEQIEFVEPVVPVKTVAASTAAAAAEEGAEAGETETGTETSTTESEIGAVAAAEIAASLEREQDAAEEDDEEDAEPAPPKAKLKIFGAFLQGERGAENTIHQFIVAEEISEDDIVADRLPLLSLGVTLAPGRYRLAWGVMDETTQRAVTRDEYVEIPDFSAGELLITEPLLARPPHMQAAEAMSTQEVYRGVRLGNVLIQDQLDRTFARDDTVEVVTLVTGWESNPNQPGRPLLEVEYRILEADGPRSLVRVPVQSLDFHVLGQQIPLAQVQRIEPGKDYRIHIRVKDLVSEEEAVKLVPIRIAPAAETEVEETPPQR